MQRNIFPGLKPTEMADGNTTGFDYEMWLGPAPKRPFDPFRCIYNFRWFWDYSGGQMTNWGAHHLDIARWIVGADAASTVAGFGGRYSLTDGGETPDVQQVTYQFPKVVVTWTVERDRRRREGRDARRIRHEGLDDAVARRLPGDAGEGGRGQGEDAGDGGALAMKGNDLNVAHARNFLDCVKSRQRPNADVEEGHRSRGDVPPRQHLDAARAEFEMGRREGAGGGRRGGQRDAHAAISGAVEAGVVPTLFT